MDTNHTPGPWYEYDMGWSGQTAIAVKHANSNFLIVPAMNKGANARLIAAAPELLEELRKCRNVIAHCISELPQAYKEAARTQMNRAGDAIAKATTPNT